MTEVCLQQAIRRIELLVRRDPASRGLASIVDRSDLLAAATELLGGERAILLTGFCVRDALIGETDGPSGTLALANALRQLGKEVVLVTDTYSEGLLAAGAAVYGAAFPTLIISLPQDDADRQITALLARVSPTHVVSIERPGTANDGHLYSMRGETLDDLVPKADRFLLSDFQCPYRTIAVGDGGNELGFGGLRAALKDKVAHGELIFCSTPADYVIPAGVSNWGAYALVAALSLLAGKCLLRSPEHEHAVLEALCIAGAVDGCTKKNEISVDGLGWDDYASTIGALYEETRSFLAPGNPAPPARQRTER